MKKLFEIYWPLIMSAGKHTLMTTFQVFFPLGIVVFVLNLVHMVYPMPTMVLKVVASIAVAILWVLLAKVGMREFAPLGRRAWTGGLVLLITAPVIMTALVFVYPARNGQTRASQERLRSGILQGSLEPYYGIVAFVTLLTAPVFLGSIAASLRKGKAENV